MSEAGSYTVDPAQLRDHAGRLAQHAGQLSTLGAELPSELPGAPLGSYAQFVTTGIATAMNRTATAFTDTAATLDAVGGALRRAADQYQGTDGTHAAGLANIGATLEEEGR